MKVIKILDVIQGEKKPVEVSITDGPNSTPVPLTDRSVRIRISNSQKNILLFQYDENSAEVIDLSTGCSNDFTLTLPPEAVAAVGDYFLEIHVVSDVFSRKFLYTYSVRMSLDSIPNELPDFPDPPVEP